MKATIAIIAALCAMPMFGQDAETYRPTVPLMLPATDSFLQSFVRLINKSDYAGEVEITAVDDGGNVFAPVTIQLAAGQTIHFNSGDLTDGNANKGITRGIGSPIEGNWRLSVDTLLDVQVLSFIRTRDGFLTAMHDVLPWQQVDLFAGIFNPASNETQRSRLRVINWGAEDATVEIEGKDDSNAVRGSVSLTLPAGHSRTLTAGDLEEGGADGLTGSLGDGMGKWQLTLRGELRSIVAQSLLYASSGHISNTSRDGFSAAEGDRADHGDTSSNPTPLALNGQRFGRINPQDDEDYFVFVITERGTLTLYTTGPTNTVGYLYDSSSESLDATSGGGVGGNFRIERDVEAGTYYLRVFEYRQDETGPYTVHADFDTHSDDDHGDTLSDATNLRINSQLSGRIHWDRDEDWFRVALNRGGTLTLYTTGPTDTVGYLYDSSSESLDATSGGGVGNNFRIERDVEAGTYYLRVFERRQDETGPYTVHAVYSN